MLVRQDSTVQEVADDLAFPNGMAVTPDNATLIIAKSWRGCLTAFDIGADGSLSRRRVWAKCGAPDGIRLGFGGCVLVCGRRRKEMRPGSGRRSGVGRGYAFACVLGGPDRQTLYITAAEWFGMDRMAEMAGTGQILAARAPAPSAGWP